MCSKNSAKKPNSGKVNGVSRSRHRIPTASLRLRYKFWILFCTLVLAGIAMVLRIETPVVWTFLYSIAGLAALTNNLGTNLK